LDEHVRIDEPAVDRWSEDSRQRERRQDLVSLPFFSLSGGVMKSNARTENRIDGLLTMMMELPTSGKYVNNIDKNLDYLHTVLKLDIINMVAEETRMRRTSRPDEDRFDG